jgi:hypothetical protein
MFRYIVIGFVLYLLYKIVFNFILPVMKVTRNVKKQFGTMQEQMQNEFNKYTNTTQPEPTPVQNSKATSKDYIDYEEVK